MAAVSTYDPASEVGCYSDVPDQRFPTLKQNHSAPADPQLSFGRGRERRGKGEWRRRVGLEREEDGDGKRDRRERLNEREEGREGESGEGRGDPILALFSTLIPAYTFTTCQI